MVSHSQIGCGSHLEPCTPEVRLDDAFFYGGYCLQLQSFLSSQCSALGFIQQVTVISRSHDHCRKLLQMKLLVIHFYFQMNISSTEWLMDFLLNTFWFCLYCCCVVFSPYHTHLQYGLVHYIHRQ